jgi:hypothetical protein
MVQDKEQWRDFMNTAMHLQLIRDGEFLEDLSH